MEISDKILKMCFDHGAQTYPEECCGVLSGPADSKDIVDGFHSFENQMTRLHNEDPERYPRDGTDGYFLDPKGYLDLQKALQKEGRIIKLIYHSHPEVGAYFSKEDRDRAIWAGEPLYPDVSYLVCGVKKEGPDGSIIAVFDPESKDFKTTPYPPEQ